ncbi:helix-turn-helix domain-containing protein [Edaphobacter aggregans]|uniref:helix-turn-helix domain-containing protein n=1 Tax=Edaphobacter aggregans TaxID=570835 RepID=UPI001FE1D541|nr:helix-turn-helix domain-containing protein [Edaphobacter aggregans]
MERSCSRLFIASRSASSTTIKEVGPEGLLDRSRKPHGCSHATSEATENAILALRSKHPSWGARKLKARLEKVQPRVNWPAASTFGNILHRARPN